MVLWIKEPTHAHATESCSHATDVCPFGLSARGPRTRSKITEIFKRALSETASRLL